MRSNELSGIFTSGRRSQGFSSTLLKVPIITHLRTVGFNLYIVIIRLTKRKLNSPKATVNTKKFLRSQLRKAALTLDTLILVCGPTEEHTLLFPDIQCFHNLCLSTGKPEISISQR